MRYRICWAVNALQCSLIMVNSKVIEIATKAGASVNFSEYLGQKTYLFAEHELLSFERLIKAEIKVGNKNLDTEQVHDTVQDTSLLERYYGYPAGKMSRP